MLHLILPDRHQVRLIQQYIRRHQYRIGKQSRVDIVGVLLRLILELCHSGQLPELGIARQYP